ncbi:class I SAM-dependent methyltransferase [Natronococcus pandeyae]|uniref:class I SAM-dependent methyltransferase n=1 Tax=Natronococcus pandeyae TaxID=2055836 RepID=UPI0016532AE9|nr:class I SAM-dependent methyltransferase [Natronococcus pandeyae]
MIDTVYEFSGLGRYCSIRPMQVRQDLETVVQRVDTAEPETIVEIGTARGGTLYAWCRCVETASTVVSVDLPEGDNRRYTYDIIPLFSSLFEDKRLVFVRGDSQTDATVREVADSATNGIGFLFIDADHSYEGVKRDFEAYEPLVGDDGIIALHDIHNPAFGVQTFWEELKCEYATEEIHHPPGRYRFDDPGIGLVHVDR